ncbi:hypothetical protein M7I_5010 [Glarea lozoyensis 74030]|nr:hypothetical protein M7I_5010 [Glarea lozoyensis 74030]
MRESREDKKWQDRKGGEEMMRVLWIGEERERTRRLEGGMNSVEVPIEDEMDSIMEPALVTDAEQLMADEVAINEAAELEARLAEILPEQHGLNQWGEYDFNPEQTSTLDAQTSYGSDDEYDDIFMDVAKEEIRTSSQPCHGQQQEPLGYLQNQDQEMMDLS